MAAVTTEPAVMRATSEAAQKRRRLYKCSICDRSFTRSEHLLRHERGRKVATLCFGEIQCSYWLQIPKPNPSRVHFVAEPTHESRFPIPHLVGSPPAEGAAAETSSFVINDLSIQTATTQKGYKKPALLPANRFLMRFKCQQSRQQMAA